MRIKDCDDCGWCDECNKNIPYKTLKEKQDKGEITMDVKYIKEQIMYPEAWDTMAYPTIEDALWELYSWEKAYRQVLEKKLEKLVTKV